VSHLRLRELERAALDGDPHARLRLWHHRLREGTARDPRRDPRPGDVVSTFEGKPRKVISCADTELWADPCLRVGGCAEYERPVAVHWIDASGSDDGRRRGTCGIETWRRAVRNGEVTALADGE